jgi:non-specific serine/threonine protein kinase
LDGLPLAIELAAARIRILPPDKLLTRLNKALDILTSRSVDLPQRHQTLRAAIDWSHALLNKQEQQLFRRLGVFIGGFTLEAVEAVCFEGQDAAFLAIDELESLIDKGLVENLEGGNRFSQLQTINEYAREKLITAGEEETFSYKHAKYFYQFAHLIHEGTQGKNQLKRIRQGTSEEANIQAALDYLLNLAIQGDEVAREMGLSMCGELWMFWHIRGKNKSAKDLVNAFFEATPDQTPSLGKCKAMMASVVAYWILGDFTSCIDQAHLHYAMAQQLSNDLEIAKASLNLLAGYMFVDSIKAKNYSDESVVLFRKLNHPYWLGIALWFNGIVHLFSGDPGKAEERYLESLRYTKKTGDLEHQGGAFGGLAMLAVMEENYDRAIELYEQSLSAYSKVGDRAEEARILSEMSWTYLALKNTDAARRYTLDSIQAYQKVGSTRGIGISMIGLAAIEAVEGHPVKALEIAGAAERFGEEEGIVNVYGDNDQGKAYLDAAKKKLSAIDIKNAIANGSKYTVKQVLQLADNAAIFMIS